MTGTYQQISKRDETVTNSKIVFKSMYLLMHVCGD